VSNPRRRRRGVRGAEDQDAFGVKWVRNGDGVSPPQPIRESVVFKCLFYNQLVPSLFHSYFVYNHDMHSYATRSRSDLHIFVTNSFLERRIKYKCSILWNSLPDYVKVCSTLKILKNSGVLGGIRGYTPYTNLRVFLTAYTHLSDHK